jgi:fumigaclavine B O-acetyltransferase
MLRIRHHHQPISFATSGSDAKTGRSINESFVPIPFDMAGERKSPVFRVQANILSDGLILCLGFHHMALDGVGLVNVATSLATCCRDSG